MKETNPEEEEEVQNESKEINTINISTEDSKESNNESQFLDESIYKDRLCCIELGNNNRIYLKYELEWTIQDLIKNIVNHDEFKKLYSSRDWIFYSSNHLTLFDVHLAPFRKLKRDNETKLDFNITFKSLHNKGLLKNPKYPFFIFKDNRNNGDMFQFHEDKIEALKKIKENENEAYLIYDNYLPRINPLIILNSHPEFENFFQMIKPVIYKLSEYNINPLINKRKSLQKGENIKKEKKDKNEKDIDDNNINNNKNNDLNWFVYDDESMNFLTTLDKEEFKLSSNIKFLEKENQKSKVLFEDVYENIKLTEEEMKNKFVNVTYVTPDDKKEIIKKFKLEFNMTGYDICESMRKKVTQLNENLVFDSAKKILKVKSLNDYILNMKTPLSQFAYINDCIINNKTPEYIILDDPILEGQKIEDLQNSTQNKSETIKISLNDKKENIKDEIKKFVRISKNKEYENIKNNKKDDLVLFIDSLEESINKHNIEEISATEKIIQQKEKEYLETSQSFAEDTFLRQQDSVIFDEDDTLTHIQNRLSSRASRVGINQSIFATNISTIPNVKTSGFINPNYLRQQQIREGKEGVVHSIYSEDTLFGILNESVMNNENSKKTVKQHRKGGPISMMTKRRSQFKELEPNIFENSIKENVNIFPLLLENSLPLNIRQIKMPFSILFNYIELNKIFYSFPKTDKNIEVLVFKFQINTGDEPFCPPVSIKWVNKRNKKDKLPCNPLFNKRIYFDTEYSTLPTFSTLIIKIKHLIYSSDGIKLLTSNTVQWVNFKLFDHNRNLMTGKHKLNLHSKEFTDFSYFDFVDNITDENSSKVYFEIDSFISQVHNSAFRDDNIEVNAQNVMITQKDQEEIEKIKKKTPFDSLNNYDKKILWTNRYKLSKIPELLPKLLLCVDYKIPQDVMELKKVLRMAVMLTPVQSMELLTGKYLHEYIRSFAVNCLRNSSINEIETFLIQLVQCLKYEMYHDNKLAIFLLKLSVAYPLTIGHCFFWSLRSEMHNVNVQQRFGLYLQVFLSKIGPKLLQIYAQEIAFVDKIYSIAQIPKNKSLNKNQIKRLFTEALTEYNNEIISKNLEISMPLSFKLRIKGIEVEKCRYMKSKKKPLWLTLKNAEENGSNIIVMFKAGDDLRMDIVTLQLFKIMQNLWYKNHLYLKMSNYNVISTGDQEGMLEVVTDSITVAQVHKEQGGALQSFKKESIKNWILSNNILSPEECCQNFLLSNVAYCCATFTLGIGDRHSDNIMLKKNGELFHIDFGHFLGHFKYKMGIKRERAPFVFTSQFKSVLDFSEENNFEKFKQVLWAAYKVLREHSDVLVTLLRILICTDIPELKEKDIEYLNQSLVLNYSVSEAETFLEEKLKESLDSWSVPINFWIHYIANK